jgi:hypothetical protein
LLTGLAIGASKGGPGRSGWVPKNLQSTNGLLLNEDVTAKPGEPQKIFYPPATRPGSAHRGRTHHLPTNCFLFGEFSHFLDLKILISTHTKGFFFCAKKEKRKKTHTHKGP